MIEIKVCQDCKELMWLHKYGVCPKDQNTHLEKENAELNSDLAELKDKFSKLYSIWFDHDCEKSESECGICKIYYAIYGVEGA